MRSVPIHTGHILILVAVTATWSIPSHSGHPVAGVNPSARPAEAPVITGVDKDDAWYRYALTGVSEPYPPNLKFLEDQGNWHTPFTRPGMVGRYDIRGWHD